MDSLNLKLRALYAACAATVSSRVRLGTNVFSEEWDALIILDACRVDALREVQDEYDFLSNVESRWSRGSTSKEWLENTFIERYREDIAETAYITSNYYAGTFDEDSRSRVEYPIAQHRTVGDSIATKMMPDDVVSAADFDRFVTLFDKLVGENEKQLHPEKVTDCAVNIAREREYDRTIIHYMQPHHPFFHTGSNEPWIKNPFEYLKDGGDFENVWDGYLGNLRLVLDHVEVLLENLDAEEAVITADHGELFGEWGLYTHGVGIPHPNLRRVPWVETTAQDSGSYTPEFTLSDETASDEVIEDRLEALGYR